MTKSIWRERARRAIDDALSALSPCSTRQEKIVAVQQSYPFGVRKNHPYKMWLSELKKEFGTKKPNDLPGIIRVDPFTRKVKCSWCEGTDCFYCLKARVALRDGTFDWPVWEKFEEDLIEHPEDAESIIEQYILWLEQNGLDFLCETIRKNERP